MNVYRFAEKMRSFLISRSFQSYRLWQIRLAILTGSLLELGVVPVILVFLGKRIDAALGFRSVLPSSIIPWAITTCFLLGIPWLGSSILWQHRYGKRDASSLGADQGTAYDRSVSLYPKPHALWGRLLAFGMGDVGQQSVCALWSHWSFSGHCHLLRQVD